VALIISGHPRSGTTILNQMCRQHPAMAMTNEFQNFLSLDVSYLQHVRSLRKNFYRRGIVRQAGVSPSIEARIESGIFLTRYLLFLRVYGANKIGVPEIERTLHRVFPGVFIVGDKFPGYIFRLDKLAHAAGLSRVIIYRDVRDVVSSFLRMARTKWRRLPSLKGNNASTTAKRWVRAIDLMERYADKLYIICYEDLVQQPERELKALGNWLGVDPVAFPAHRIRDTSIGKHKSGLTHEELKTVMEIAGPTMERLGYEI